MSIVKSTSIDKTGIYKADEDVSRCPAIAALGLDKVVSRTCDLCMRSCSVQSV